MSLPHHLHIQPVHDVTLLHIGRRYRLVAHPPLGSPFHFHDGVLKDIVFAPAPLDMPIPHEEQFDPQLFTLVGHLLFDHLSNSCSRPSVSFPSYVLPEDLVMRVPFGQIKNSIDPLSHQPLRCTVFDILSDEEVVRWQQMQPPDLCLIEESEPEHVDFSGPLLLPLLRAHDLAFSSSSDDGGISSPSSSFSSSSVPCKRATKPANKHNFVRHYRRRIRRQKQPIR